jgi:hypothetical protein
MARKRPAALSVVGWASLVLGVSWLLWLTFGRGQEALDLLRAGSGDAAAAARLGQRGLAGAGAVHATVLTLLLELTLALLWAAAGVALLLHSPFARRAALFACYGAVAVEGLSTLLRVFLLTPDGQPIPLSPVVVNGAITVCALGLWGGLLLPEVETAYAGASDKEAEVS